MSAFCAGVEVILIRLASDAEMGMAAVYLAASDYTNGAILNVDGGIALVNP